MVNTVDFFYSSDGKYRNNLQCVSENQKGSHLRTRAMSFLLQDGLESSKVIELLSWRFKFTEWHLTMIYRSFKFQNSSLYQQVQRLFWSSGMWSANTSVCSVIGWTRALHSSPHTPALCKDAHPPHTHVQIHTSTPPWLVWPQPGSKKKLWRLRLLFSLAFKSWSYCGIQNSDKHDVSESHSRIVCGGSISLN